MFSGFVSQTFFSGTIFVNPLRLVCGIDFYFSFTGHSTFFLLLLLFVPELWTMNLLMMSGCQQAHLTRFFIFVCENEAFFSSPNPWKLFSCFQTFHTQNSHTPIWITRFFSIDLTILLSENKKKILKNFFLNQTNMQKSDFNRWES